MQAPVFGVATASVGEKDCEAFIHHADEAMYAVKNNTKIHDFGKLPPLGSAAVV